MSIASMDLVYCAWNDACHDMGEHPISSLGGLAVLHEVGWLVKEQEDTITLSVEYQDGMESTRLWITIPKVNIVTLKRTTLEKAFKLTTPRQRKAKPVVVAAQDPKEPAL